jgi:pyridoxamine 5'-phosphate oxidase
MPDPGERARSGSSFDQADVAPLHSEQLPEPLPADPFPLLGAWYDEARRRKVQPNPNAMTLATVGRDGRPSARIVLCKDLGIDDGSLVFYTNYESRKGREIDAHPWAALLFHWDAMDRQVRIEGAVTRVTDAESDAYFASRPWESRIGAWSSEQSRPVASRRELLDRVVATMKQFGIDPARPPTSGDQVHVPRPPHWGGYRVVADTVELWVSGKGRVHDRAAWKRDVARAGDGFRTGTWQSTRLCP